MIFNLILFGLTIILYLIIFSIKKYNSNTKKQLFLKIMFFIFFLLVAFRGFNIGNDTNKYLILFRNAAYLKWDIVEFDGYYEFGFLLLNVLISLVSNSERFYMIIMSFIFNFCIYKYIKDNSENYLLSVVMYIGLLFIYTSMTMMRQYTALAILLYSLKYAKNKQLFKYIICVMFAVTFHTSAWIGLLYYFIANSQFSKKKCFIILICAIFATIMIGPLSNIMSNIVGRTNYYESRVGSDSIANTIYTIIYAIQFIFSYILIRNKKENSFNLYCMLFAMAMNMIGINMNILSRISLYFNALTITALPNIITNNVKPAKEKLLINFLAIAFFLTYSTVIIAYRPEWNSAYNYKICYNTYEGCQR